MSKCFPKV
jgi:hypothetical protein